MPYTDATCLLDAKGGHIAYADTGGGALVLAIPGMGDLRVE